jgi:DNA ligase-associated metallophosphoesterase
MHDLTLLPESAVLHSPTRTLVVADVHLGKAAAFRAGGIPVPEGDDAHDLDRLAALIRKHNAARLVIAGDLFHAPAGVTPALESRLAGFLTDLAIPLVLATGNHDRKLRGLPANIAATPHIDLAPGGPRVVHDPADIAEPDCFHIAGHLHPVVRIRDGRRTSLRLPCFWQRENLLILPAFGTFTGGSVITPARGDRVFTALRDQIVEIPT